MSRQIIRGELFDRSLEMYVPEELPSESIKKYVRKATLSAGGNLASHQLGLRARTEGGTYDIVGRLTKLTVAASKEAEFYLVDRDGTFDSVYLESKGQVRDYGSPKEPLAVVKGTFRITMGSQTAGTYITAFEIQKYIPGTLAIA